MRVTELVRGTARSQLVPVFHGPWEVGHPDHERKRKFPFITCEKIVPFPEPSAVPISSMYHTRASGLDAAAWQ